MDNLSGAARLRHSYVPPVRPIPGLAEDVRRYLLTRPRSLPPKYFYDGRGSQLFESICDTPEYYPSRTEAALLATQARTIIETIRPAHLLELGSGSSRKTRHLLEGCNGARVHPCYWPFDVSARMMLDAGAALVEDYPWLEVHALSGDYTGGINQLPLPDDGGTRLIAFLGGTLGNFEPEAARALLIEARELMGPRDALLLGLDRAKDSARLEAAYNDTQGFTAAFNRNVLHVLNRELGGDFPVDAYHHRAVFNQADSRIEMRLGAERAHRVRLDGLDTAFDVDAGEEILTEISRKFTPDAIETLLASAGLEIDTHFEAGDGDYSLLLAVQAKA